MYNPTFPLLIVTCLGALKRPLLQHHAVVPAKNDIIFIVCFALNNHSFTTKLPSNSLDQNSHNTEKKNQHFVPKFYLGRFSINENKKAVCAFAFDVKKFIPNARIKGQAAKNFYYGKDGIIENNLGSLEGKWAESLRQIETSAVPGNSSKLFFELLRFTIMTDLRNPVRKVLSENAIDTNAIRMKGQIARNLIPEIPPLYSGIANKYIDHWVANAKTKSVTYMLQKVDAIIKISCDLKLVFVENRTQTPFITSDYPIVFYNQLFEAKSDAQNIGSAYASLGCQIFIPISDKHLLMFYDSKVYHIQNKSKRVSATKEDVDQLNKLQVLNCNSAVYGNEHFTEAYLRTLLDPSSLNGPKHTSSFPHNKIGLNLSYITLSSFAVKIRFKPGSLPQRKKAIQAIKDSKLLTRRSKKNI